MRTNSSSIGYFKFFEKSIPEIIGELTGFAPDMSEYSRIFWM